MSRPAPLHAILRQRMERLLPPLCWAASLAFAAWAAATVFWQFTAPRSPHALPHVDSDPRRAAEDILGAFDAGPGTLAAPAAISVESYRLIGLATGFGALPGFAILHTGDAHSINLMAGEALPDGRRLERILADRIVLRSGNTLSELPLSAAPAADASVSALPAPPPAIRRPSTSTD